MKTARVRIAVAILPNGEYGAAGWSDEDDPSNLEFAAAEALQSPGAYAVHYVEADIPLPESPKSVTVEGDVVK